MQLGISHENLMGFGRENPPNHATRQFCMTVLGLKLSRRANAVSSLHGEVSRAMWKGLYPGQAGRRGADRAHHQRRACAVVAGAADVPALRPASGRGLAEHSSGPAKTWEDIENVDDGELWETHLSLKSQLLDFVRRRAHGAGGAARRAARRRCSGWTRCCRRMR